MSSFIRRFGSYTRLHIPFVYRSDLRIAVVSTFALGAFGASYVRADHIYSDTVEETSLITKKELSLHNSKENGAWVAINGKVYDLTNFLPDHPGGDGVILRAAGKDATKMFNTIHSRRVIGNFLGPEHLVGEMSESFDTEVSSEEEIVQEKERLQKLNNLPALSRIYNLNDFEYIARHILVPSAWAYYSGGADDEFSLRENHYAFQRIYFNPKVLIDVRNVDMSTTMLGSNTTAPFYCSAAAMAELGHPDGELSLARACGREGIIQMISSSASYSFDEITDEGLLSKVTHWFQLYVRPDRTHSYRMFDRCEEKGVKAVFVTVDTPELGRREKDFKFRFTDDENEEFDTLTSYEDPGLTWADIDQFKAATDIPIVIKGVQTPQDVLLAIEHKVDGVVLANHGGRQLEFSRPPLEVLAEVMPLLRQRQLEDKIEIYIDGGIRRGTDVVKALCLGAKGVGLGRPFLYANSGYGEKGVRRAIQLLKNEVELTMKLLGVTAIDQLTPELVDLRGLNGRTTHADRMYDGNYEPLEPPSFKTK